MSWETLGIAMLATGLALYAVLYFSPGRIDTLAGTKYGDTVAQMTGLGLVSFGASLATALVI